MPMLDAVTPASIAKISSAATQMAVMRFPRLVVCFMKIPFCWNGRLLLYPVIIRNRCNFVNKRDREVGLTELAPDSTARPGKSGRAHTKIPDSPILYDVQAPNLIHFPRFLEKVYYAASYRNRL